ncbi:hypothetical protein NW767_013887 [Fusarium falciforme]|nr:hypothetical protein NW767_013887 [Fusarium falciforme]KAJ4242928.1 hypothetical protein NW757_011647 [Fusarium falciforme]
MKRTYFTDRTEQMENETKPYATLSDAAPVRISPALQGDHILMDPASGVRSCVSDLPIFYNVLLDAAAEELELGTKQAYTSRDHPVSFSELPTMWTG